MINSKNSPNPQNHYEYVFIGAGLSTLLILLEIAEQIPLQQKKILVLDSNLNQYMERTWCFWTKNPTKWGSIAKKSWSKAGVFEGIQTNLLNISPYQYQMLKSSDFRSYTFEKLKVLPNLEWKNENVLDVQYPTVIGAERLYYGDYVFDSRFDLEQIQQHKGLNFYQQFLGYTIELEHPILNDEEIRLMDFRMHQPNAVAFCYVLPTDKKTVLVEYTLFSATIRDWNDLRSSLEQYLKTHFSDQSYSLLDIEKSIIPMSDIQFPSVHPNWVKIGTGGGMSKPSTGYTFHFAEKHAALIVKSLLTNTTLPTVKDLYPSKFNFYDKVLLNYLDKNPQNGAKLFYRLFKRNTPETVFDFLNNETSLFREIKIFSSLPIIPFIKAAIRSLV